MAAAVTAVPAAATEPVNMAAAVTVVLVAVTEPVTAAAAATGVPVAATEPVTAAAAATGVPVAATEPVTAAAATAEAVAVAAATTEAVAEGAAVTAVPAATTAAAGAAARVPEHATSKHLSLKDTFLIRLQDWWKDLKVTTFLPIKTLGFLVYGGMMSLYPFLTLHARSLGVTESELGIVYGILPLISLIGPPIAGMVADKIGNFKYFLSAIVFTSGLASLLYMAVPVGRIHHKMPDVLPVSLSCSGTGSVSYLTTLNKLNCEYEDVAEPVDVIVSSCTPECELARALMEDFTIANNFQEELESEPKTTSAVIERLAQAIPKVNFNPAAIYEAFQAEVQGAGANRTLVLATNICPSLNERLMSWLVKNQSLSSNTTDESLLPVEAILDEKYITSLPFLASNEEDTEAVPAQSSKLQLAQECSAQCRVLLVRKGLCSNTVSVESINPQMTFWLYVLIRILNTVTLVMSMPLIEGATVAILKQYDGDYGFQRMYVSLGPLIMTPLTGALMDAFSSYTHTQDYRPAFYVYFTLKLVSAGVILMMDLEFKKPSKRVIKDFKLSITNFEICCCLFMCFFAGVCSGAMDTFLFWLLQDMGASKSLMGLTLTVGNLCSLPILLFASPIISCLGHMNTIILGFCFYVVRYIGYSVIYNPWLCLPFEALECFTMALLLTAIMAYTAELSTPTTTATIQGLVSGLYNGVGSGAGSLVGGFLIAAIGVRRTFQGMAAATSVASLLYYVVNRIFFRHKALERELMKLKETSINYSSVCEQALIAETNKKDVEGGDDLRGRNNLEYRE